MPSDTPTAQELWDSTDNHRRKGGPGMPENFKLDHHYAAVGGFHLDRPCWMDNQYRDFDLNHAAAILRDHGRMWLENNRCMPQSERREYSTDPKVEPVYAVEIYFEMTGEKREFVRPTMLAAINAAIGAVLDAKEGK